jgi:arsenite methyltransferase
VDLPDRVLSTFAAQLGHPHGLPGRVLGRLLNRANRAAITGAVDALDLPSDGVAADLGFGGGAGIDLLLRRLGDSGQVHGIDQSATMLSAAAHRFRREVETGRLKLHQAPIEHLPLETSSLDGAITLNTLYFITDLAGALKEWARVLKPSGQLVIGLGDPNQMARQRVTEHGFRIRPLAEVTNALLAAGLEVDQHRPIGSGRNLFHLLVAQPY